MVPASAQSLGELIAAAKAEGTVTTIALPHDWCNYGGVIEGFKAKYGIEVNELNPDAGSADELEAIRANKDNKGPQAPDVIDVGFSFGPAAKDEGLIQPYKVSTWDTIPDNVKDADGFWYGDYYGVLSFAVNSDLVSEPPADWSDLLKPEFANSVALAGDPRASNQAILGVYAAGLAAGGAAGEEAGRKGLEYFAEMNKQLRPGHRQVRHARPGRHAGHRLVGLQRAIQPGRAAGQSAGRRGCAEVGRGRRRLRPGDLCLRAAPECRKALDGIPLFRRGSAQVAGGLLPPDPLRRAR
jgi:hypothetical protein